MIEKSLREISWLVDELTYREDPALSYSTISKYQREGFENLEHLFDRTTSPSLTFGSVVDCILTDGMDAFNERFAVADIPEMSETIMKIVEALHSTFGEENDSINQIKDADTLSVIDSFGYQPRWKAQTRIDDIRVKGKAYYDVLSVCENKEVISTTVYNDAVACVDALRESPATKWYFQKDNPFDDIERLYQLKFKGSYGGVRLRSMMDLCIVDHKNKIIYPCDLKTSGKPEYKFYKSFIDWNYHIQANLYTELLRQTIEKDEYFKDFDIAPYTFIVICNKTRNPLTWEWSYSETIGELMVGTVRFPNWRKLCLELDKYIKLNPAVPMGISETHKNRISEWIEKEFK